jgi:hypothetical protein
MSFSGGQVSKHKIGHSGGTQTVADVASECRPGLLNVNNSKAFDVWVSIGNANVASFFTACLPAL